MGRRTRVRQDLRRHGVGRRLGDGRGPLADPAADPRARPRGCARRPAVRPEPRVRPEHGDRERARRAVQAREGLGKKGREIIRDVDAYTAGINAYLVKNHPGIKPWTRNDTIAAAAVLAGQYGVGGGDEARRAELLAELQAELGATQGRAVWNDLREQQDPETPATATRSFPYGASTSEDGNVTLDAGSLSNSVERAGAARRRERGT